MLPLFTLRFDNIVVVQGSIIISRLLELVTMIADHH